MPHDRLAPSELNEYHEYRRTKLNHLYICKKCARSFDSKEKTNKCPLCGGKVEEMERDDLPNKITFVCASCHKKFIAEKAEKCPRCGSKFLHSHRLTEMSGREVLSMRKDRIKDRLKKLIKKKDG